MDYQKQEIGSFIDNDDDFDVKKVVGKVLSNWYLYVFSILICFLLAYFYTRYATPGYNIISKITVSDQSSAPGGQQLSNSLGSFSDLLDLSSNAYNEIDIIKSNLLMTDVVKALHLNVTIFRRGEINAIELYDEAPFTVEVVAKRDTFQGRVYNLDLKDNNIHISNSKDNLNENIKFGSIVSLGQYDLIFARKPGRSFNNGSYQLSIESVDGKTQQLLKALNVDLTDKKSTTLILTLQYPNPKKGEAILSKLMDLYLKSNMQNKIEIADSTINFIDYRLGIVGKELSGIENNFAKFKQVNNLSDVDEQGKALVENVSTYYNKLNDLELQIALVDDISKFINDPVNKRIIPSSFSVQDPVFADAIGKYNELLVDRDKLLLSYKENNPVVASVDAEIENVRVGLLKSFNTYKQGLLVTLKEVKSKNSELDNQVKSVPQKEKVFLDYTREQNLMEQMYLYLLQKKEETAITKTSTVSTSRIIDPAKSEFLPYEPKVPVILLIGIIIGIIIPSFYLYLKEALNIKVINKSDIESNTRIPTLGEIGNIPDGKSLIVENNSRSILSEQFRALRTNLQFVLSNSKCSVIMVTSSMSGEGKSLITMNLGSIVALSGKKVLLLELDLRKPKLSTNLGLDYNLGFTNYVVSESAQIEQYIQPTFFSPNCFIISSGPVPPNPSELLHSERLGLMFEVLKSKFDYIIIDSAPIGLVSDAQLIEKYTDVTLYVVRQQYTLKSQLNIVNDLVKGGKFRKTYLVVNDIKSRKAGYHGYGYGYGYGHGYGYGYGYGEAEDSKKKPWYNGIFNKN